MSSSKKVSKPHDLFFKKVMNNPLAAEEFIQTHFPPSIATLIDPGSLELTDSSFIDKDFNEYRTDILYKALFKGIPGYLHILEPVLLEPVFENEAVILFGTRSNSEKGCRL